MALSQLVIPSSAATACTCTAHAAVTLSPNAMCSKLNSRPMLPVWEAPSLSTRTVSPGSACLEVTWVGVTLNPKP